jgi:hypothetical protein
MRRKLGVLAAVGFVLIIALATAGAVPSDALV